MNTAAAIYENLTTIMSRETGSRSKAASEAFGDSSQQRFSDVLPLAQAAQEQASETEASQEASGDVPSTTDEDTVDPVSEEEVPSHDEEKTDEASYSQTAGWPFVELIPSPVQSQAQGTAGAVEAVESAMGELTTEPTALGGPSLENTGSPSSAASSALGVTGAVAAEARMPQVEGGQQTQATPTVDQTESDPVAPNVVTNVMISSKQDGAQAATAADEQVPVISQDPQKTAIASAAEAAETLSGKAQMEQPDTENEWTEDSSGAETSNTASKSEGRDVLMPSVKSPDGSAQEQTPEVGRAQTKTQSASPQVNAESASSVKSQTSSPGYDPATTDQEDAASESAEVAATGSPKASWMDAEGKDVSAASLKNTGTEGATTPEARVSAVGETSTSSRGVASQSQSHATAQTSSSQSPVQSVGEQILDSVRASMANGDRQVSIRLLPPELGTVVVRFQEQGEQLNGIVEVSNGDTRREVERALPQVIRSLQEAGVQLRRVEVVTADQPDNRNMGGENLPQDVWQQHQGTGQGREHTYGSQQTRWSQNLGGQSTVRQGSSTEQQRTGASQGRIDLLL